MRTVFELCTNQQFTINELAVIRNSTVGEVQWLLDDARKALQTSFFNRYSMS
jgi:DNA-directed RNA polymerase specialized sigma24 family protein